VIVGRLLGALGCGLKSNANAVEVAVLGHELAVLGRQVPPIHNPQWMATLHRLAPDNLSHSTR
jgi:hypothetical protein